MADILYLVDRLEDLLNSGFHVPLTNYACVDEEGFLDLIDQMRIAIPNEIRQAQRVMQEKDRILAQAREEADRVLAQAHEEAGRVLSEHELVKATHSRVQSLMSTAQAEADEVRSGADDYAQGVLEDLATELDRINRTVINGLDSLRARRAEREPLPQLQEPDHEHAELNLSLDEDEL